jgi:hypothetical protein
MRRLTWLAPAVALMAIAVLGGGCASVRRPARLASDRTDPHIECSEAARYTSLAQLRRAATVVATFRPTGETIVRRSAGIPFTLAQITVTKTLAGTPLAGKPIVRELGAPGLIVDGGCGGSVSKSHEYLAYLMPFRLRHTGPPVHDQYVIVGGGHALFAPGLGARRHTGWCPRWGTSGSLTPAEAQL